MALQTKIKLGGIVMALENDGSLTIERAVFSVTVKAGIENLATALIEINPNVLIYGTPGSLTHLEKNGISGALSISEITGEKPMSFKHRMSSISYRYESGVIFDLEDPDQVQEAAELRIPKIDMVICNLYAFEKKIAEAIAEGKTGKDLERVAIENIDVGGPCMVRAAMKNHLCTAIVTDPDDYPAIIAELKNTGIITLATRKSLMVKAVKLTTEYDYQIFKFFEKAYNVC